MSTTSWLLGSAVIVAYGVVQGNVFNLFPVPGGATPYFESPYWVGLPRHTAMAVTALQLLAAVGYFLWSSWVYQQTEGMRLVIADRVFLVASLAWPFASYFYVLAPSLPRAVLACAPLAVAGGATLGMTVVAFTNDAPPGAVMGVLLLGMVVVLADAVGWSAACVAQALRAT